MTSSDDWRKTVLANIGAGGTGEKFDLTPEIVETSEAASRALGDAKKMGGYVFFGHLEKERPDLLDFRAAGSKWQIVHLWLRHGGRLKD
jgi:hypothetical protein